MRFDAAAYRDKPVFMGSGFLLRKPRNDLS
jgi:hypothetical protein